MWFKVVFNKDGSIASCEEIAASFKDGGRVFCVEADSKTAAVSGAKKAFARQRNRWRAAGLCIACGAKPAPDRASCASCLERSRANSKKHHHHGPRGASPQERREQALAHLDKAREKKRQLCGFRPFREMNRGNRRLVMRALYDALSVLEQFGPEALRDWIVKTGEECGLPLEMRRLPPDHVVAAYEALKEELSFVPGKAAAE